MSVKCMCIEKYNCTVGEIFTAIITKRQDKFSNDKTFKDYTIVITGKNGPTGKTNLCNQLNELGFKAIELNRDLNIFDFIDFKEDKNRLLIDVNQKFIFVILNKNIKET